MSDRVIPVCMRVLALNKKDLADVHCGKSIGGPWDCWHLVDPSTWTESIRDEIRRLCGGVEKLKLKWQKTATLIDENADEVYFIRVWGLDAVPPSLHNDQAFAATTVEPE
jgi:hypothetical protein